MQGKKQGEKRTKTEKFVLNAGVKILRVSMLTVAVAERMKEAGKHAGLLLLVIYVGMRELEILMEVCGTCRTVGKVTGEIITPYLF